MRQSGWLGAACLPLCGAMLWSGAASAACVLKRFATLDATIENGTPVTQAKINGHSVRLRISSGASFSAVTAEVAREMGLSAKGISTQFEIRQGGKLVPAGIAFVDTLQLGGSPIKGVNFLIAGTSEAGVPGQIGQNVLGRRDTEYDLDHKAVRLMYGEGCLGQNPVYWAGTQPVMSLPIEAMEGVNQNTIGTVAVNGVNLRAMFSSGGRSAISLKAAKQLGMVPAGSDASKEWDDAAADAGHRAKFETMDIGGETLRGGSLRVIEMSDTFVDVVVGLDFFLAHRIYVGNGLRRMYFTYGSGPVFGVVPAPAAP